MSEQDGVTFVIDSVGDCRYLVTEAAGVLQFEEKPPKIRASHVEPCNCILRGIFHTLRYAAGDKGWLAGFTRVWPCEWRINLGPIGGGILPIRYRDRIKAIDAEVIVLNRLLVTEREQAFMAWADSLPSKWATAWENARKFVEEHTP